MQENKNSNWKHYFIKETIVVTLILPLISLIIGILFSNLIKSTLQETIIISLSLMLFLSFLEFNIMYQIVVKKAFEQNEKIVSKIDQLKLLSQLQDKLFGLTHPYFRKWAFLKLEKFIDENQGLLDGKNWTNPHAEDTYGIEGLLYTADYGSLKCLSSVENYWEDNFTREYLDAQESLIKIKKVRIQRVFSLDKKKYSEFYSIMERQYNLGIEIYYIFRDNEYIDPAWLHEDYLIQDDILTVEIFCDSHKYLDARENKELITINKCRVDEKLERFRRIRERATKFTLLKDVVE